MFVQNFGGTNKEYYGIFESGLLYPRLQVTRCTLSSYNHNEVSRSKPQLRNVYGVNLTLFNLFYTKYLHVLLQVKPYHLCYFKTQSVDPGKG